MSESNKITQLKVQLERFMDQLDGLDPEKTSIEDVDQLIQMIEKIEKDLTR
ncbi:SE1561 family protein [Gracilibacillus sp. YIM 98692]|uniref:SE1561 family protein n=1 Tax=Gracilibacillus sp. YIM 98692 TaxID=2663532 RepID=UPI0013D1464A|nr:SE1561 family protein [Gracilibacillus sp. YIM 98692]